MGATGRNIHRLLMSVRNSSRVFCCVRKQPSMHDVTVDDPGFCTPRIVMQRCLRRSVSIVLRAAPMGTSTHVASITTATPRGLIASCTAMAICFVRRSCTCNRRLNVSAIRASLEMPRTSLFGMYAIATCRADDVRFDVEQPGGS